MYLDLDATNASDIDALGVDVMAGIELAVAAISRGEMVVVVDLADPENEGNLVMAAEKVTPEAVNFMAIEGRGLISAALPRERLDRLEIGPMVADATNPRRTAFHVGVDHRMLATTGISAADRAATIAALADPDATPDDFARPGHVLPLACEEGGVLRRAGHPEAAIDLALLAGLSAAGVVCEIAADDGEMARLPALLDFARRHELPVLAIDDLVAHRRAHQRLVRRIGAAPLPRAAAIFTAITYEELLSGDRHLALVLGELGDGAEVPVRVHHECLVGDVFGSLGCDCSRRLEFSLDRIEAEGRGVLLYLRGRDGHAVDRDEVDIAAAQILGDLGVTGRARSVAARRSGD